MKCISYVFSATLTNRYFADRPADRSEVSNKLGVKS
jgi:hypothetical protein